MSISKSCVYLDDDKRNRLQIHSKRLRVPMSVLIRAGLDTILRILDQDLPIWDKNGEVIIRDQMEGTDENQA